MSKAHPLVRTGLAMLLLATTAQAQLRRDGVSALTDAEFWQIFTTMSEVGGSFPSENFVSNEMTYQHVIPALQKTVRPDGVYLGVGPEQNFTYIANLKPRLAIIFDIRRQNAMAHLMYKAIFEMSPTRAEFVSRLFSRPLAGRVAPTAKVNDMFAVVAAAQPSDSAYVANQHAIFANLVNKHRFVLTPGDSAAIEHLFEVFFEAGPDLNYGYRLGRRGTSYSTYPTYGVLQTRTNADSVQMAFLATEDNYRAVRDMQVRNLIVPVVGDFAGPKAIRAVGDYLRQRSMTVQAFYLSNVEQYLFQNGVADAFYQNVATLPLDSTSTFIRSVPPGAGVPFGFGNGRPNIPAGFGGSLSGSMRISINGGVTSAFQTFDSAGMGWMRTMNDSNGVAVTRLYRDSLGVLLLQRTDTTRGQNATSSGTVPMPNIFVPLPNGPRMPVVAPGSRPPTFIVGAGGLVSGIAPIKNTIGEFTAGRVIGYGDIIAMTKLDGWK
jgi:hypothetical protein